jgi:hypothetical protein
MKKLIVLMCIGCLCVTMINAQELENGIREAVSRFAMRLLRPLDVNIGAMTLEGNDTPSGFSIYLYNLVYYYVDENPSFRIVTRGPSRPDEQQKGLLKGTFAQRRDMVEVYLYLISETDGRSFGTHRFTFPLAELTSRDISIEPEIVPNIPFPPVQTETIHIEASFNSNTRTYMHADELILTVTADRNCYFKIIHIDVNNQFKMIYPRNRNDNNQLRANEYRNVFGVDGNRQILCEPYGAETLVVVASSAQFPNIEREYSQPWRPATEETIRAAIAGEGQARYPFTIIPPHDVYEYTRPENMTEFYQALRDDVTRQNGQFENDAVNGFYSVYTINNIRGSYRVPSDRPNVIQFATYYLDAYSADANRGTRTRGSPHSFSFARPQNVAQAVLTVRSSILGKGGTFNGDEQQGNFRASGITGQYQVTDVVRVTISEKPFVIPNSLIENEVKNYFGVR